MNVKRFSRLRLAAVTVVATSVVGATYGQENETSEAVQAEEIITLAEFTVSTIKDDSFVATQSTSGTRIATDIINLPFSVSVLTQDFVKEFQLFDLDEQAPFISGMAAGDQNQGGGGGTRLRGFIVPYFRNGFYRTQAPDSNSIARTEVVRGPQSAIYGRVSPGGVVNYISKKPGNKPAYEANYVVGSYDYQRASGSATGPVISDKVFYRVDATYYDFKRPTDFWYNRTSNLSGSIVYKCSPDTQVTLEHEYTNRIMQGGQAFTRWTHVDNGITTTEGSVFYMPDHELGDRLARFSSNGAKARVTRRSNSSYLTIEHKFSPGLSMRAGLTYSNRAYQQDTPSQSATWATDPTTSRQTVLATLEGIWVDTSRGIWTADRSMVHQTIDYEEMGIQVDLTKKWNTRVAQRTLLTFDAYSNDYDRDYWALSGTALNTALNALGFTTTAQLNAWKNPDPFNPSVSGYYEIPSFDPSTWTHNTTNTYYNKYEYYGGLLNHTIDLMNGRLSWTGSVRVDWCDFLVKGQDAEKQETTYSTGLNYHIIPRSLVVYGNVATGFNPSPQFDPNTGELLGNQESFGGEVGFKGVLLGDALSYGLSVFNVEQENEVTDNPANPSGSDPDLPRYIPGATTRARGINVEVGGRVTRNLTLLGNIAWTDVRIIENAADSTLIGTRPASTQSAPPRTYSFAARYNFREGLLSGLRVGLTYQYAQQYIRIAATSSSTSVRVPYYVDEKSEWGGVVGYAFKKFKNGMRADMSLNVTNIFDEKKMTVAAYYPEGRTVRFTTSVHF